jgi:hypothetical protein
MSLPKNKGRPTPKKKDTLKRLMPKMTDKEKKEAKSQYFRDKLQLIDELVLPNSKREKRLEILSNMEDLNISTAKTGGLSIKDLQNLLDEGRRQKLQLGKPRKRKTKADEDGVYAKTYAHGGGVRKAKFMDS